MPDPARFFHYLPYPLKVVAASWRGRTLRTWRYGEDTARLVAEARERESWSRDELVTWQRALVGEFLERAVAEIPYYRRRWATSGTGPQDRRVNELCNWPVLKKQDLRIDPGAFLADSANPRSMFPIQTSGSTGTPLSFWISRGNLRRWYALFEARWRNWYGVSRFDRWAILGGQLVVRPGQTKPPFWVWNVSLRQLYLSVYHITSESVTQYLGAMRQHGVVYLLGYPSAMYEVARETLKQGLDAPELKVVISNAEPLLPLHRKVISEAFHCPVRDTYGMAEMVGGAGECERGTMHLWPEAGVVEVLDDYDRPVPPGEIGRLVCTGLINADMPLIRYEIGDRGAIAPPNEGCPCGRILPILNEIEGRLDDVVVTPDGRKVGRLDTVFKIALPIREAQIVQHSVHTISVKIVPASGYNRESEVEIIRRLRDRVGNMAVDIERVESIPRGPNGKFRAVVSAIRMDGARSRKDTPGND